MRKLRFENTISQGGSGSWDGTTLVTTAPIFSFSNGFEQAVLPAGAGVLPAAMFGKAPGADCYIVHATMYTATPLTTSDLLQIKTRAPANVRHSWLATPGNNRAFILRPDDTLHFTLTTSSQAFLELLLEPLAKENEFGQVLMGYLEALAAIPGPGGTSELEVSANTVLAPWSGTLRVTSTAGAGIALTLPAAAGQSLNDRLIVTRNGAGAVAITPAGADTINKSASVVNMASNNASVMLIGAGTDWAAL